MLAERREMVLTMPEQVQCDPLGKRIVSLRPKLPFVPFFRQSAILVERDDRFDVL
jgi:hypothetical protein